MKDSNLESLRRAFAVRESSKISEYPYLDLTAQEFLDYMAADNTGNPEDLVQCLIKLFRARDYNDDDETLRRWAISCLADQ